MSLLSDISSGTLAYTWCLLLFGLGRLDAVHIGFSFFVVVVSFAYAMQ